tara:strand:+ start:60 stop:494 length:435 start_codon:yes stop_codon:yes gene_type:complete
MSNIVTPKISFIINNREQNIQNNLLKAKLLKEESDLIINKLKLEQDKARNEARKKIESSITSNKALIEKSDKDFSKSIAKKINETTDNINLEKTKKITELLQNSSSIAEKIINKVIDINVDKKELNIFIKKSSVLITKEHKNGN